jgi:hypothetical protein
MNWGINVVAGRRGFVRQTYQPGETICLMMAGIYSRYFVGGCDSRHDRVWSLSNSSSPARRRTLLPADLENNRQLTAT